MEFQDYKRLSSEEQQFFLYEKLSKIDVIESKLDSKYASKWVEKAMTYGISAVVIGFIGSLLAIIGWHGPQDATSLHQITQN